MRALKYSGVEWIGDIPTEWKVYPVRYAFSENREKNTEGLVTNALQFKFGTIIPKNNFDADEDNYVADTITNYTIVEPRMIMINGLNLNYDLKSLRVGMVKEKGVITSAYLSLIPDETIIDAEFATYLFKGYETKMAFHNMGAGIRKTLGFKEFKNQPILVPNLAEQQVVVRFLDDKLAEIDTVIEKTKATIEEYKKLKQSVITEAVTKGIRGNRAMKDSGVEWIGDIPAEWNVKKLKYTSEFKQNKYNEADGDLTYIGLENIVAWNGQYIETASEYDKEQSLICEANDILFGKLRPYLAKVYISPKKQCCSGEFCVIAIKEQNTKFMWYQLISHGFIFMVDRSTYGTKMPRANADYVKNMSVSIPSLEEQEEIADFLDRKCAKFDKLIADKTHLLEEMESYKMSVLYEYVTGKKEVNNING